MARGGRGSLCGALVLCALTPTTAFGDTRGSKAQELLDEFIALGRGTPDRKAFDRREHILFELRDVPGDAGYPMLLKAIPRVKRPDEFVLAARFCGRVRDRQHLHVITKQAAKMGNPAFVRLLGELLGRDPPDEVKRWILEKGLRSPTPILAGASCRAAATLQLEGAVEPLRRVVRLTVTNRKRQRLAFEATRALGVMPKPVWRETLLPAVKHRAVAIRLAAADLLPTVTSPDAPVQDAVRLLLGDESWRVRKATLNTIRSKKNEAYTELLVETLERDPHLACKAMAQAGLRAISGRDLDYDVSAWRRWLRDKAAGVSAKRGYSVVHYFGHAIVSQNLCFIVDLSGSMGKPKSVKGTRLTIARRELIRAVEGLPEKTRFNIIVFASSVRLWKPKGAVNATPKAVQEAKRWIFGRFRARGQTSTYAALEAAFNADEELDTIFLLSDGKPSVGDYESRTGVLHAMYARNWDRQVTIHTIALSLSEILRQGKEGEDWGEKFMKRLAAANGGECRVVARRPE